ncbi:hypothetical protein JTB14_006054 [Gonioctena quinquepunctata]|nr:hypothetical protein JTB14_006054 [Gonioctena quinquepunctata]
MEESTCLDKGNNDQEGEVGMTTPNNAQWHHRHEKGVSDNDYDSEEGASEPSDYEEHSDTDEATSEIGEDSASEEELERQNNVNVCTTGMEEMMNSLENCFSQPILDTNPPGNIPET